MGSFIRISLQSVWGMSVFFLFQILATDAFAPPRTPRTAEQISWLCQFVQAQLLHNRDVESVVPFASHFNPSIQETRLRLFEMIEALGRTWRPLDATRLIMHYLASHYSQDIYSTPATFLETGESDRPARFFYRRNLARILFDILTEPHNPNYARYINTPYTAADGSAYFEGDAAHLIIIIRATDGAVYRIRRDTSVPREEWVPNFNPPHATLIHPMNEQTMRENPIIFNPPNPIVSPPAPSQ